MICVVEMELDLGGQFRNLREPHILARSKVMTRPKGLLIIVFENSLLGFFMTHCFTNPLLCTTFSKDAVKI